MTHIMKRNKLLLVLIILAFSIVTPEASLGKPGKRPVDDSNNPITSQTVTVKLKQKRSRGRHPHLTQEQRDKKEIKARKAYEELKTPEDYPE